jgi:hypothetical protein
VGTAARSAYAEYSPDIHLPGPDGERARAEIAGRLAVTEPPRYSPDGFSVGYHYADSPLVVGGEGQAAITMGDHLQRARPGFRLPHTWIDGDRSVLDLLGPDFTLLRTDTRADVASWSSAARALGIPLTVVDLPVRRPDRYPAELLLVRPDQHVAWMGGEHARPAEVLHTVTGRVAAQPR